MDRVIVLSCPALAVLNTLRDGAATEGELGRVVASRCVLASDRAREATRRTLEGLLRAGIAEQVAGSDGVQRWVLTVPAHVLLHAQDLWAELLRFAPQEEKPGA